MGNCRGGDGCRVSFWVFFLNSLERKDVFEVFLKVVGKSGWESDGMKQVAENKGKT